MFPLSLLTNCMEERATVTFRDLSRRTVGEDAAHAVLNSLSTLTAPAFRAMICPDF